MAQQGASSLLLAWEEEEEEQELQEQEEPCLRSATLSLGQEYKEASRM